MKTQKQIADLISSKIEEINLSQQVELADKPKWDATRRAIEAAYKTLDSKMDSLEKKLVFDLNRGGDEDDYVREIRDVAETIKDLADSL